MQLCWIISFVLFSFTIADSFSLLHIVCLFQKNYIFCNVDVNMKPLKILLSMCMISTWHAQIITYNFSPCFYLFASWNGTRQVLDVTLILLINYYFWYYSKSISFSCPKLRHHVHYQHWCCHEWAMSETQMDVLVSFHNVSICWTMPNSWGLVVSVTIISNKTHPPW